MMEGAAVAEAGNGRPYELDPEAMVLSAVLLEPSLLESLDLGVRHFLDPRNRAIFAAMSSLNEQAIAVDLLAVVEELRRGGTLEKAGGSPYVAELCGLTSTTAGAPEHARITRERMAKKKAREALGNLKKALENGHTLSEVASDIRELLDELTQDEGRPLAAYAKGSGDLIEAKAEPRISYVGPGLMPAGVLSLDVGSPGAGKTFIATQRACSIASGLPWLGFETRKARVGILELENDACDLWPRLEASWKALGIEDLSVRNQVRVITADSLGLSRLNFLEEWLRVVRWATDDGLGVLMVDSLERVHGGDELADMPHLATAFERIARASGCALNVQHHERKGPTGKKAEASRSDDLNQTRGHSTLFATAKVQMRIVDVPGTQFRQLRWGKVNLGPSPEPIWLRQAESGVFERIDQPKTKKQAEKEWSLEAVRAVLIEAAERGGINSREGGEKAGVSHDVFTRRAKELGAERIGGSKASRWLLFDASDSTQHSPQYGGFDSTRAAPSPIGAASSVESHTTQKEFDAD